MKKPFQQSGNSMVDFLGIGAMRAGTTWLYTKLALHPQVLFPAGKEVHFWDAKIERGLLWYRTLFEAPNDGIRRGEITPSYATLPHETIVDIAHLNPALRIFYLLRNPIERAWSHALTPVRNHHMTIDAIPDQWFIDHFHSAASLSKGDYEACLRRWRSVFPSDQLMVLRFETLRDEPQELLEQCAAHLRIDGDFYRTLSGGTIPWRAIREKVFPGLSHPIRPSLLPVLEELYHPRIHALSEYLGWALDDWLTRS